MVVAGRYSSHDEWLEAVRAGVGVSICPDLTARYYPRPGCRVRAGDRHGAVAVSHRLAARSGRPARPRLRGVRRPRGGRGVSAEVTATSEPRSAASTSCSYSQALRSSGSWAASCGVPADLLGPVGQVVDVRAPAAQALDLRRAGEPRALVALEPEARALGPGLAQAQGERRAVLEGLRRALREEREHRVRGVADERDAAAHEARAAARGRRTRRGRPSARGAAASGPRRPSPRARPAGPRACPRRLHDSVRHSPAGTIATRLTSRPADTG